MKDYKKFKETLVQFGELNKQLALQEERQADSENDDRKAMISELRNDVYETRVLLLTLFKEN